MGNYEQFLAIMTQKILNNDPTWEIRKAFKYFDDDGTGLITLENLQRAFTELGEPMSVPELKAMIRADDLDKDDALNEEDFLRIMQNTSHFSQQISPSFYVVA